MKSGMRAGMKKDVFDPELSRHLGPEKAPEELWDRIRGARVSVSPQARTGWGRAWVLAGAALAAVAIVAGATVWFNRGLSGEERAVRALYRAPEKLQFHSNDPAELRAWVKAGSGLDVPIPVHTASMVQVI